ncbi:MAG: hypothetical protein ACRETZ_06745 [Steroidobacteraceae bacterium]
MNTAADTVSNRAEDKPGLTTEEQKPATDGALVELGKVSDTQGGWVGFKTDVGMGFSAY